MLPRSSLRPWLGRPTGISMLAAILLVALLSTGAVVARAVDGTPVADTATPAASPATGAAAGNGTDNVAAGVNTTDGRSVYAIRLKIVQTSADTVDATNAAVAVSSCTDCTTVAIAFEGVLVAGSPTTFDPTNLALAVNTDCAGCTTFADAYQQVVQHSTRVRITGQGRREIAAIRRDLESLRTANLSLTEIVARVKADEAAFADVLLNDCVPIGHAKRAPAPDAAATTTGPTADTSPAATASQSDSPQPTPSTSPTDSAAPQPQPQQADSATPTSTPTPAASPSA